MSKPSENPRKALGKGLSALLPTRSGAAARPADAPASPAGTKDAVLRVPVDAIQPNPLQPRNTFQPEKLQELAQSIQANGIIQPLVVLRKGDHYQLVAGERRWRAAKIAGLTEVPVVVQDIADDRLLEITLIENIQREDLNPIEVAQAFDRLIRQLGLSHEELGKRTGKDRTTITNTLRLLRLPEPVQLLLAEHRLSMGHARAVLGLPTPELQIDIAQKAVDEGLSVRQVEKLVQRLLQPKPEPEAPKPPDPNVKAAIQEMESALGTRVRIVEKTPQRGRIEIEYYSQDDLDRIYNLIVTR
ncbi:MAG: ParB/RepB/Spo0J family partition protein [Bryobacteraceae bacterium]|nr:ParB/RepB/Spo0J family partition protein [Bryobacteraceae bacterium]